MLRLLALSSRRSPSYLAKRSSTHSRLVLKPGFLGDSHRTHAKMTQPAEQRARPSPDPDTVPDSKKPRLDADTGEASGEANAGSAEAMEVDQANGKGKGKGKRSKRLTRKDKKKKKTLPDIYTNEYVAYRDTIALLGQEAVAAAEEQETDWTSPFENKIELELVVSELSSTGEHGYFVDTVPAIHPAKVAAAFTGTDFPTVRCHRWNPSPSEIPPRKRNHYRSRK